jgi:aspartate/methionine/tyrosine aminotransferase
MTLNMLGIKTVPLTTTEKDGFLPSPKLAATLITPKTRVITLVTLNNPVCPNIWLYVHFWAGTDLYYQTGAIYPPNLIAAFANFAKAYSIALIVDETYRDFVIPGPPHMLFSPSPEMSISSTEVHPTWPWSW